MSSRRRLGSLLLLAGVSLVCIQRFVVRQEDAANSMTPPVTHDPHGSVPSISDQLALGAAEGSAPVRDPVGEALRVNEKLAGAWGDTGDPDLGEYRSIEELQERARKLIMTFAKDGDWVAEQMAWEIEIDGHSAPGKAW